MKAKLTVKGAILYVIMIIVLAAFGMFAVMSAKRETAPARAETWTAPDGGWNSTSENGETVWTRAANTVYTTKGSEITGNALEFELRMNSKQNSDDKVFVQYGTPTGGEYNFVFNHFTSKFTIGRSFGLESNGYPSGDYYTEENYSQNNGEWVKLRMVFAEHYLAAFKVTESGDTLIALTTNTWDTDRFTGTGAYVNIRGWNTDYSIKNPKVVSVALPDADRVWKAYKGWTKSETGGETVYTRTANEVLFAEVESGKNALELDFRVEHEDANVDSINLVQYADKGGNTYGFLYNSTSKSFSIGKYKGIGSSIFPEHDTLASVSYTQSKDAWVKLRFVFDKKMLAVYRVGETDELMVSYEPTDVKDVFDGGHIGVKGFNTGISVKNMSFVSYEHNEPTPERKLWNIVSGWEESVEGEETVYTRTQSRGILSTRGGEIEGNALDVDVRITERYDGSENLVVFNVINRDGQTYGFKYDHLGYKFAVSKFTGEDGNGYPELSDIASAAYTLPQNKWTRLRFVFDAHFLAVYEMKGDEATMIVSTYQTGDDAFDDCYIDIRGWNTALAVKGMEFSAVTADPTEIGLIDLAFKDRSSVTPWKASVGEIGYSDALMLTLANGAVFTSPSLNVSPGDRNSALLSVRNTLVVRLKNDSAANKVKLYFVTDKDKVYNEAKSVTFDIQPNSEYATYYFNLSGNARAAGYLRGFAFEFIGANSGSVLIDEITFSREDPIYNYAGEITSCTATDDTVTVVGTVDEKYNGKTVTVYESAVENYLESLNYKGGMPVLGTATVTNGAFTVAFPFKNGTMTRLSTFMIAAVDGVKVDKTFKIENYADFSENKYAFQTAALAVDVTTSPYNAKGDGFTNDDLAIQLAIDYVGAQGGGKVILPGDVNDPYGRRYLTTGLTLKSNVELVIETGAVLWQSHRREEYTKYEVFIGHDNMGGSAAWGLSALMHYPLIYINEAQNVKVTGGGTIRMDDTGTEWLDGNGYSWDSNIMVGCTNVVHLVPIGIYASRNVEIKDVTILRASCWHFYIRESSNIYIGNVDMKEVNCINGDGIDFSTAVHDVLVDRCSLYSNDDALVLGVTVNDPRDDLSIWRNKCTLQDKTVHDFTIKSSNLFGGHGITFIPWASDNSDAEKAEIYDITVTDCVLGGTSTPVGAWADNPFYGKSNYFLGTYGHTDHAEKDDYSPIRDITIVNNVYNGNCSFYGIQVTNLVTDANMRGATEFVNGNFDKTVHTGAGYADESAWTTGLSYWTRTGSAVGTDKKVDGKGYSAYLGGGELYQGFYKTMGAYEVSIDAMLCGGSATLFVRDANGKVLAEKPLAVGTEFETHTLSFKLERGMLVRAGVKHEGAADELVWIDNAAITAVADPTVFEVAGEETEFELDDADNFRVYSSSGAGVRYENGSLVTGSGGEYKIMLANSGKLGDHAVSVDIAAPSGSKIDAGLYLFAKDAGNSPDDIDAYNVQVESTNGTTYTVKLFRFNGYYVQGALATSAALTVADGLISLKAVVKNGTIYVFADGGTEPVISYEVTDAEPGNVGLRSNSSRATFYNFKLTAVDYAEATGDRTELDGLLELAALFSAPGYTEQSFGRLEQAVAAAKALSENAKQSEIDAVSARIRAAINSLKPVSGISSAKTELNVAVGFAEQLDKTLYSEASYKDLSDAIDAAKTLLNGEATEEQLTAATARLRETASKLEAAPSSNANGDSADDGFNGLALGLCLGGLAVGAAIALLVTHLLNKRKEKK